MIRFALGGAMTVIAGLIASRYGPVVGGLFLAFPAIFPASATLIEKHQRERKKKAGLSGARRGKEAAALDAVRRSGCLSSEADGLIISGSETDVCVLATVLAAVDLGYRVIVVRDGVSSFFRKWHGNKQRRNPTVPRGLNWRQ
jgi:nicotinamidase-related amidase